MKQLVYKIFLFALLSSSLGLASNQSVYAQSISLHDSLRHMFTQMNEEAKDSILQKAVKEALTLYTKNIIDNTLSKKLLIIDSILVGAQVNYPITLPYATTLLELFKGLSPRQEHPDYATSLGSLASLYNQMGQYDKALPLYEQALAIRKKVLGEQHPGYATSLNSLAALYSDMGQYDKALPLCEQALAIRKKISGEQHPGYANSLNNLAGLYKNMGQYDKALPLYEQALAIRKKISGEQHPGYANSLNSLAALYSDMGQYDKALPLCEQALAIRKKISGEQHPGYANSLNSLAALYSDMGQYDKALPLYEQALAIRKKISGEQHPGYANSLNNLALLHKGMGQYDKALPLYEQALAIRKKILGEQHPYYATSLNSLAALYSDMGQYDKALPLCEQALAIRKKILGEQHPGYANSLNNLALLHKGMGQYDKALPLYEQALAIRKKILGEQHPDYANSLNNLAVLYSDMGQYDKALPLYEQALAIRKKILVEQHPDYAQSLYNLGKLYSSIGNPIKSSALVIKASDCTLRYLSQTYVTLSEQDKLKLLKIKASHFDYLPSLLFTGGAEQPSLVKQAYASELTLKGMVLEDQKEVLNSIRKSKDSTSLQLYKQWYSNKAFIGKQFLLPLAKRVPYFDSLQEATNQLEQQLSRRAAAFRNLQQSQHITANDISQKLLRGEIAVEFIRFQLFNKKWTDSIVYAALVLLPGDSTPHFIPLFEEKQLERLLKPYLSANNSFAQYAAIEQLYGKSSNSTSASLYQQLWEPLEPFLKDVHTVYYAPVGLLHRVAFDALPTDATHRLIDTYQLHQVLSTRSVVLPSLIAQKPRSAALWGNINYNTHLSQPIEPVSDTTFNDTTVSSFNFYTDDTRGTRGGMEWSSLPGTKRELDTLATMFQHAAIPISIDSGAAASEEAFKLLSGKGPQLLHFATHGFFLPVEKNKTNDNDALSAAGGNTFTLQQNPMFRSGLVLAGGNPAWRGEEPAVGREDGILTAYEIAQLDLSSTEIVVLSACETALGDVQGNEGVIGLQRAFKLAGVKQLLMSLWRVPDKETMELMTLFYRNWMKGQSPGEALRTAQLKMKEKYPPFYWAAFVVVE